MKVQKKTLACSLVAVAVWILASVGCDISPRLNTVESEVATVQAQQYQQAQRQQITEASIAKQLSTINKDINATEQRLSNLESTVAELSKSDKDMTQQLSRIESKLDALNYSGIVITWLQLIISVAVLGVGVSIIAGFWYFHQRRLSWAEDEE